MNRRIYDIFKEPTIFSQSTPGYRVKVKLAVRGCSKKPLIGLFEKKSHQVISALNHPSHHESINKALLLISSWIIDENIDPYEETLSNESFSASLPDSKLFEKTKEAETTLGNQKDDKGGETNRKQESLKYIQLVLDDKTKLCQLTLVFNGYNKTNLKPKLEKLFETGAFQGLWVNVQPKPINAIFGPVWHQVMGLPYATQVLLNNEFYFHPGCFMQANPRQFEKVLISIRNFLLDFKGNGKSCGNSKGGNSSNSNSCHSSNNQDNGDSNDKDQKKVLESDLAAKDLLITEYYAGVGVIGLSVSDLAKSVTCIEINPFAKDCFEEQIKKTPEKKQRVKFIEGDSSQLTNFLTDSSVIIIDPPRKGMEKRMLYSLVAADVDSIVTLYCGEDAFLKERDLFLEWGWQVQKMEFYEFFTDSDNLEILCVYSK